MYIYYVYAYLRNKDSATAKAGTPYYIGKGKLNRAYEKHRISVPLDKTLIQFIAINLSEHEAHLLEQKLIRHYGRKDHVTGILINRTNGGEGTSGYNHTEEHKRYMSLISSERKHSVLSKAKISKAHKGKVVSEETKQKMRTKRHTAESKQKMVNAHIGKIHSTETKQKIARANSNISDETRAKMSASAKNKVRTKEHCENLSKSQKGKTLTDEHKRKLSLALKGKPKK